MRNLVYILVLILLVSSPLTALSQEDCEPCSGTKQNQELVEIYKLYRKAIKEARDTGYQCGSDDDYVDYGPLKTKLGNCADWALVSWGALVVKKWDCWKIVKVRARKQFWFLHHNFIYIIPKCGGAKVFMDPWRSGRPDVYVDDAFPFKSGFGGWIHYPIEIHNAGDAPRDPNP